MACTRLNLARKRLATVLYGGFGQDGEQRVNTEGGSGTDNTFSTSYSLYTKCYDHPLHLAYTGNDA